MNAYHLPYWSLFPASSCIILGCVCFFLVFLLIINREPDGVVIVLANEKRLQNQVYRQIKRKLMDKLDLAKVHHLKELNSSYIISYLHFLSLTNILTLPKLSPPLKLHLIWHNLRLACFLPARLTRMHVCLRNQNKCKPSIEIILTKDD